MHLIITLKISFKKNGFITFDCATLFGTNWPILFQGEKAYSCAQCGTRFTYRNGLIKHTKLNRCPKKIVTADGETIIKKRSRTTSTKSKHFVAQSESSHESPIQISQSPIHDLPQTPESRKLNLVDQKLLEGVLRRQSGSGLNEDFAGSSESQFFLPQIEGGGVMTFGMFNRDVAMTTSTTVTTMTSPTTTKVETTHQAVVDGVLPDSTVAELSLATGIGN